MAKCTIDGLEVEFTQGENLIEVAKRAGIDIPVFCYHPGLTVVAQCRMCAVEIEKNPKLQTACSTPAQEGMVVHTQSALAKRNQESVMEFLLINHPLDCAICDKSGECDLQDFSYEYGSPNMRTSEPRRTYDADDMGPVIKKNMNRCIHCTRCIRFASEIAGIPEMVAVQRANHTEITTVTGEPLQTAYAGNYSDICPTGSLTLKDFRFRKRVWYLNKTPSICEGCSRGCNIEVHEDHDKIYRFLPRKNMAINKYWMCDEGRFSFHYINSPDRIIEPALVNGEEIINVDWPEAVKIAQEGLRQNKVLVLIASDLTQEDAMAIQSGLTGKAEFFHFGTPGINATADDADEDKILKRTNKTANLHGLEKLGLKGFTGAFKNYDSVFIFRGGRAKINPQWLAEKHRNVVGIGVFMKQEAALFTAILPGRAFAEKDGTIVNFQGVEQKFNQAIHAPATTSTTAELVAMLLGENIPVTVSLSNKTMKPGVKPELKGVAP